MPPSHSLLLQSTLSTPHARKIPPLQAQPPTLTLLLTSRRSHQNACSDQFFADREAGFDTRFGVKANLTAYNALYDPNMRHFFENSVVQSHLYRTGQIDKAGRVIDLDLNKSKLQIIEKEFVNAGRSAPSKRRI